LGAQGDIAHEQNLDVAAGPVETALAGISNSLMAR
jgi:hypothetical protein